MPKRARYVARTSRPIEKLIGSINQTVASTMSNAVSLNPGVACTFVGGNIQVHYTALDTGATTPYTIWIYIVLVRDGQAVSNINTTNGNPFYEPEQDVLWACACAVNPEASGVQQTITPVMAKIKTQRKMKEGDQIRLLAQSPTVNNGALLVGTLTGFFKE